MGQRGVAIGFVSPANLVVAGAHNGQRAGLYPNQHSKKVFEIRQVYTTCRDTFIGPHGESMQKMKVCRNASGNWVAHHEGQSTHRTAALVGTLRSQVGKTSSILLAEATGDPVAYQVFADRKFRRRIQGDLLRARTGTTSEYTLPNGDQIELTFDEKYQEESTEILQKANGISAVSGTFRVDARWMTAPIGAKLRTAPDYLAQETEIDIPASGAVEALGYVTGTRGYDWVLVGRSGVGFGYVPATKLIAHGQNSAARRALRNERRQATAELIEVTTTCRPVSYETRRGSGKFEACQQTDGSWALRDDPVRGTKFADGRSVTGQSTPEVT